MARTLSRGMTGQDVRALQDVLNFHIRRGTPLKVDGIFGPKTHARVLDFQRANKLKPDGFVGPLTNAQLFEVTTLTAPIVFFPNLNLPTVGSAPTTGGGFGIKPPRLIPPLQWPGPPTPPPGPFTLGGTFKLFPDSLTLLPEFNGPANALGMKITFPTRKDPSTRSSPAGSRSWT